MNRIQQLDAILLDDQLSSLLTTQLTAFQNASLPRSIKRFAVTHNNKLKLIIELLLISLTIIPKNATYADSLTNQSLNPKRKINNLIYISLLILQKLSTITNFFSTITPSSSLLTTTIPILTLLNTISFLRSGTYPTILHRITQSNYISTGISISSNPTSISYEFQNRQIFWSSISEVAQSLNLSQWLDRINQSGRRKVDVKRGSGEVVKVGVCPYDGLNVCNPYKVDCCGCVGCYVCVVGGLGEECPVCGEVVRKVLMIEN